MVCGGWRVERGRRGVCEPLILVPILVALLMLVVRVVSVGLVLVVLIVLGARR